MSAARWLVLLSLASLLVAGCMGPGESVRGKGRVYRTYTDIVVQDFVGAEKREPRCVDDGCAEFFLVRVSGSENATRIQGDGDRRICSKPWLFDLELATRTVRYNETRYTFDTTSLHTMVAESLWTPFVTPDGSLVEGCPTLYGLRSYARAPYPQHERTVGSYGGYEFTVYRDGSIAFGEADALFGIGKKLVASYGRLRTENDVTYYLQGGFEIVNLGPWPVENLIPGQGAPVTRDPG